MYHTVFTGCTVENGVIRTARLYTKGGFYELSAKVFVDASADADVATSAGVTSVYGREEDNLAQPMTMNFHVYGVDREKVCDFVLNNLDDMVRYTPRNLRELRHYDISGASAGFRPQRMRVNFISTGTLCSVLKRTLTANMW